MELVLFMEVFIGGQFIHNNLTYLRVSRSYAEMDSRFLKGNQNFYFDGTTKVQVSKN